MAARRSEKRQLLRGPTRIAARRSHSVRSAHSLRSFRFGEAYERLPAFVRDLGMSDLDCPPTLLHGLMLRPLPARRGRGRLTPQTHGRQTTFPRRSHPGHRRASRAPGGVPDRCFAIVNLVPCALPKVEVAGPAVVKIHFRLAQPVLSLDSPSRFFPSDKPT